MNGIVPHPLQVRFSRWIAHCCARSVGLPKLARRRRLGRVQCCPYSEAYERVCLMDDADGNPSFSPELATQLAKQGVVAVLVIDRLQDAVPVAQALSVGGVGAIELTLRTPVALECVREIRAAVPDMLVGVGTILTAQQVDQVVEAGAAFGVAPGLNPRTVEAARRRGLSFAPGVCTPTDIELAIQTGCSLLKFFPCEPSGGLPYLRSIAAPFTHLGVRFIPLGGIDLANARTYLDDPLIQAIGGSWIAPRPLIQQGRWQEITDNAAAASQLVASMRSAAKEGAQ